ncbi:NUDIX hydrolase 11-like protein [Tanacetum coccineum]
MSDFSFSNASDEDDLGDIYFITQAVQYHQLLQQGEISNIRNMIYRYHETAEERPIADYFRQVSLNHFTIARDEKTTVFKRRQKGARKDVERAFGVLQGREVSLPGGRKDEADTDDIRTALREAEEEIGLDPGLVDVVTVLEPFTTKEKVTVVPVMGILWNKQAFNPVPNVDEVESIFYAPLEMFLKDENRRHVEKEFEGDRYLLQYFDLETDNKAYVIWALTAGMLIAAASLVYQRKPDFEPRMPKFWFKNQHSRF